MGYVGLGSVYGVNQFEARSRYPHLHPGHSIVETAGRFHRTTADRAPWRGLRHGRRLLVVEQAKVRRRSQVRGQGSRRKLARLQFAAVKQPSLGRSKKLRDGCLFGPQPGIQLASKKDWLWRLPFVEQLPVFCIAASSNAHPAHPLCASGPLPIAAATPTAIRHILVHLRASHSLPQFLLSKILQVLAQGLVGPNSRDFVADSLNFRTSPISL